MVRCEEGGGDEEEAVKNTTMSVVDEEEAVKDTMFEIGVLASGLQQVLEEPNDADVAQVSRCTINGWTDDAGKRSRTYFF